MTALAALDRSSIFTAKGEGYGVIPDSSPRGRVEQLLRVLVRVARSCREALLPPDRTLARMTGMSVSTVQRALLDAESIVDDQGNPRPLLERKWVEMERDGNVVECRIFRLHFEIVASRRGRPKSVKPTEKRSKKFGPPLLKSEQSDCSNLSNVPSYEGIQEEKLQGGVGGECPGRHPPPPPGEPEDDPVPLPHELPEMIALALEPGSAGEPMRAAFRGWVRDGKMLAKHVPAEVLADPAAFRAPNRPVAPSPAPGTVDPPSNGHGRATGGFLASLVRGLRPSLADETRRLAAAGDPIARAELAALEAAAPPPDPAPEAPRPAAAPPEVGAPGGMDA